MTRLNKGNKYNAKQVVIDGYVFPSILEGERYKALKLLQYAGEIRGFAMQVTFRLYVDTYRVDFLVIANDGSFWVEDVKGYMTRTSARKIKEFQKLYPFIPIKIEK